ncbi:TetR/AcrR family transcriptional regulator [Streptomyces sp. NPDC005803]|uniref:TetR/AcrR family transcriptional regulator n=1 Tax=Streptomyces sp. NPDC005803 TaxID=3154297 RepID=UPI003408DA9D
METGAEVGVASCGGKGQTGYHERVKAQNLERIICAARDLFLEQGYDRTSLAQIARKAGVSTGTLFKRHPSKSALFKAVAAQQWQLDVQYAEPPAPGDPQDGLTRIGRDYACLLGRPGTAALFRLVVAELPRLPELADSVGTGFAIDRGPFFERLRSYLEAEAEAGTLHFRSADGRGLTAAEVAQQFLSLIGGQLMWPQMIQNDFIPPGPEETTIVDEAVALMVSRYGTVV